MRVRHACGNAGCARPHPEQWLLIEWPAGAAEPRKYFLSNPPADTAINELMAAVHMRWRIERACRDLKQELGLGHYEGRGWRGFHHHAALTIAAYGFLVAERRAADRRSGTQKTFIVRQMPALPDYLPRGSPARSGTWPTPSRRFAICSAFDSSIASATARIAVSEAQNYFCDTARLVGLTFI